MRRHDKPLKAEQAKDLAPQARQPLAGPELQNLVGDIRAMIESARGRVAQAVNAGLVSLYLLFYHRRLKRLVALPPVDDYGESVDDWLMISRER